MNYFSFHVGTQMSGIKDEDFVVSNYSPLINFAIGHLFTHYLEGQIGYRGFYFNYIEDDSRHYYHFLYSSIKLNFVNLLTKNSQKCNWGLIIGTGPGYFYNYHYNNSNFCANLSGELYLQLNNKCRLNGELSSIIGWDIYQGNLDIIPGLSLGFSYYFE